MTNRHTHTHTEGIYDLPIPAFGQREIIILFLFKGNYKVNKVFYPQAPKQGETGGVFSIGFLVMFSTLVGKL